MTTDASGPRGPAPSDREPPQESTARRVFADAKAGAAEAARVSTPVIKSVASRSRRVASRLGDWLATVGWGKFFLVAVLLMILGGIATSIFSNDERIVVRSADRVNVDIRVSEDGVRIAAPDAPGAVTTPPAPPAPPGSPKTTERAPEKASPSGGMAITEKGIRIFADKDGKKVAVIVDDKGVRVERVPDSAAPAVGTGDVVIEGDGKTIHIPREVAQDPEKFAEAIDHARDQIETIVQDQINKQVTREVRRYRAKGGADWVMGFITLLIVTGVIVKVVLGGKKKAERRAQVATATAAEESLKRQLVEAQLKMMQAQVEPHFLFNTLASVDYLIETDPKTASKMQKNLIQYLRAALPQMREGSTTLGKEVQLCRAFLEILKFRMEDRLQYTVIVPQGLQSAQFPPMMLQSLVENSIKHGLEPKPEGGSLTISADIANGKLRVTVADTGLGFAVSGQPGTGVGLANVRERLAALYGGAARLNIEANSPTGTIVTIEVPYSFEADASAVNGAAQPA
ncbi:MAG TPA: histidine kinase [Burkholderiaceae bacterium]|nr:histidine kinase [Burkholderiaceae bacterium]